MTWIWLNLDFDNFWPEVLCELHIDPARMEIFLKSNHTWFLWSKVIRTFPPQLMEWKYSVISLNTLSNNNNILMTFHWVEVTQLILDPANQINMRYILTQVEFVLVSFVTYTTCWLLFDTIILSSISRHKYARWVTHLLFFVFCTLLY